MDGSMTAKKSVFADKVGNYSQPYMGSVSLCEYRP